jgi:hypothetical protein
MALLHNHEPAHSKQRVCDSEGTYRAPSGVLFCTAHHRAVITVGDKAVALPLPVTTNVAARLTEALAPVAKMMTPPPGNDRILSEACREVIAANRLSNRLGRRLSTEVAAQSLMLAVADWERAEARS